MPSYNAHHSLHEGKTMKTTFALTAIAGASLLAACASAPPLTFTNLDEDQNGFVSVSSVADADRFGSLDDVTGFDADGDAQLDAAEFNAYMSSDNRANAIQVAEQRKIERERQLQSSRSSGGSSGGGYGS